MDELIGSNLEPSTVNSLLPIVIHAFQLRATAWEHTARREGPQEPTFPYQRFPDETQNGPIWSAKKRELHTFLDRQALQTKKYFAFEFLDLSPRYSLVLRRR